MKKLLLAAAILGSAFMANAQDDDFATEKGTFSTEIQFNPFGSNVFSNGGAFSGTYFVTDKQAITFSIGLSGTNEKTQSYDADGKEYEYNTKYNGEFSIGVGYKYYFLNYKRINLYAGANVNYIHKFAGDKTEGQMENVNKGDYTWTNNGTGNGFSVYATTGIDFSIYKGLYMGAEIKLGFKDTLKSGYKVKAVSGGQTFEQDYKAGGHTFNGGFSVVPVFRLGWAF